MLRLCADKTPGFSLLFSELDSVVCAFNASAFNLAISDGSNISHALRTALKSVSDGLTFKSLVKLLTADSLIMSGMRILR